MSDANDDAQNYALAVIAAVVALVIAGVLTLSISRSGPPKAPKAPAQAAAAPAAAAAPRVYFEVDSDALPEPESSTAERALAMGEGGRVF